VGNGTKVIKKYQRREWSEGERNIGAAGATRALLNGGQGESCRLNGEHWVQGDAGVVYVLVSRYFGMITRLSGRHDD
jgi:hypothetical protein